MSRRRSPSEPESTYALQDSGKSRYLLTRGSWGTGIMHLELHFAHGFSVFSGQGDSLPQGVVLDWFGSVIYMYDN